MVYGGKECLNWHLMHIPQDHSKLMLYFLIFESFEQKFSVFKVFFTTITCIDSLFLTCKFVSAVVPVIVIIWKLGTCSWFWWTVKDLCVYWFFFFWGGGDNFRSWCSFRYWYLFISSFFYAALATYLFLWKKNMNSH